MNIETFYNAKIIDRQLFKALLKSNIYDNLYIITLDGNIIEKFWCESEEKAITHFRKTLTK